MIKTDLDLKHIIKFRRLSNIWKIGKTVDGNIYYYNRITKESQWNYPENCQNYHKEMRLISNIMKSIASLKFVPNAVPLSNKQSKQVYECKSSAKWICGRTVDGKNYYYNTETNKSQYELPILKETDTNLKYVFVPAEKN